MREQQLINWSSYKNLLLQESLPNYQIHPNWQPIKFAENRIYPRSKQQVFSLNMFVSQHLKYAIQTLTHTHNIHTRFTAVSFCFSTASPFVSQCLNQYVPAIFYSWSRLAEKAQALQFKKTHANTENVCAKGMCNNKRVSRT